MRRRQSWLILIALLTAAVLFRIPALMNTGAVNSDAAVVGLQARHILHGEWSWFLWGTGYQASFDSLIAALAFAVFGAHPLTLISCALAGHLVLICFVFDLLRKRIGIGPATIACLLLAFAPAPIHSVNLSPPRQWCITTFFAAVWLLDSMWDARRPALVGALGCFLGVLSLYLDLYSVQMMVAFGLFTIACCFDGAAARSESLRRLRYCVAGLCLGGVLFALSHLNPGAGGIPGGLSLARLKHNLDLMLTQCLPFLLSYRVYLSGPEGPFVVKVPTPFYWVQVAGALVLAAGIVFGGAALFFKSIPWTTRRLGALGFVVSASVLGAFLLSTAPIDVWAVRYLSPLLWTAPLALAPAAWWLGGRRFAAVLAPYVLSSAVAGWIAFGPYVDGFRPIRSARGMAAEEQDVGEFLRSRGVHFAAAEYWLSYRLTFLLDENPVVIPLAARDDRYAPYRQGFERSSVVGYIFHPSAPRATPEQVEAQLRADHTTYELVQIHDFTVLIANRKP